MDALTLAGTEETPGIVLDKTKGVFEISGRSIPEDPREFYKSVLAWLKQYAVNPNPTTRVVFKLEYFNTASAKQILDLLYTLETIRGISIQWYFDEEDEDMEEAGQEFAELVKIPFEFKTY